ncbi:MAG: YibE/F family protein, partial [Oscillospiraceae bacterium]|nr:YibE/F family protein [Oscillospiraceae bacterium]
YNSSTLLLFNTEMIVVELLQAIAGSFGILLTIPLTSFACGALYADKK